jgi:hypothetical protein
MSLVKSSHPLDVEESSLVEEVELRRTCLGSVMLPCLMSSSSDPFRRFSLSLLILSDSVSTVGSFIAHFSTSFGTSTPIPNSLCSFSRAAHSRTRLHRMSASSSSEEDDELYSLDLRFVLRCRCCCLPYNFDDDGHDPFDESDSDDEELDELFRRRR